MLEISQGQLVPLGYGKYARSERIVAIEPIEDGRGPGRRTRVRVEGVEEAVIASRSEAAIMADMVEDRDAPTRISAHLGQDRLHVRDQRRIAPVVTGGVLSAAGIAGVGALDEGPRRKPPGSKSESAGGRS